MRRCIGFFLLTLAGLLGCESPPHEAATVMDEPAEWRLGEEPILEVGVLEGDEAYQLHQVTDGTLLDDGRIALTNQGSAEVRVYDPDGRILASSGESGDGPGEWRWLTAVEQLAGDTLAVFDGRLDRVGLVHARTGEYIGELEDDRLDSVRRPLAFHAGLLIEGVGTDELGALLPVLRRVDVLTAERPPARLRVLDDGTVLAFPLDTDGTAPLRIYDLEGRHRATLPLPPSFRPLEITADRVLGIWRDSLDVEYLQLRALDGRTPLGSPTLAGALAAADSVPRDRRLTSNDAPWAMAAARNVATAQEIHYSRHGSYATDVERLGSPERPLSLEEGLVPQIVYAGTSGWMARFIDPQAGIGCFMAYGAFQLPEGVPPGRPICWGR